MRLSVVALISPFFITLASADCYRSGAYGKKEVATNGVGVYCAKVVGWYAEGQARPMCIGKKNDDTHWWFNFSNESKGGMTLNKTHCEASILERINSCTRGGDTKDHDKWFFR